MCKKSREPIEHLLIHCDIARELQSMAESLQDSMVMN